MNEINFIDRTFDKDAAGNYSISIQANQNGLTYCIFDNKANSYVLFRKHRFENILLVRDLIENVTIALEKDVTLNLNFQAVRFLGFTQQSTLVPDAFFDSHNMAEYLMYNHAGDIDQEIFSNFISPPGVHSIFALPRDLVSLISRHFKNTEFMCQATSFLGHLVHQKYAFDKSAIYVGLNTGFFDVACTGDGKLKLYNTFQYANENDLLYYVVFVCNQLGFDTQTIPLYLSGEQSSKLSYYEILKQFLPETSYDEATGIPELSSGLKQLGTTRFLNLLNLQMCASSAELTGAERSK